MLEVERDARSNAYMEKASKYLNEAKRLLKEGAYAQSVMQADACVCSGMKSVLALEDMIFEDGAVSRDQMMERFDSMYFETEALPPEWRGTVADLNQMKDQIEKNAGYIPPKEKAGVLIANIQFFLQQLVDYLVQRNAMYWG